jgi:hypothetical protein
MSLSALATLAGHASTAPDAAKTPAGKTGGGTSARTRTSFATMIAGAAKPAARAAVSRTGRGADKPTHDKRDDDSTRDDSRAAVADASVPVAALPAAAPPSAADTPPAPDKPDADLAKRTVSASASAAASAPADPSAADIDLTQIPVDTTDPTLAPVLAALADSLSAKQAGDLPGAPVQTVPAPPQAAAAPVAAPATATAALMASRIVPKGEPFSGRADARVPATADRKTADDADPEPSDASPDPGGSIGAAPIPVAANAPVAPGGHAPIAEAATSRLATGGADRQLDLAKQGAWLDGISHDIAATGTGAGPLRFAVSPQHLGAVQVEMTSGGDGTTVTLTASSEAGRVALADARPQLIADARAQGIHIANAQVDVGGGQAGSDSRPSSSGQNDSGYSGSPNGGFSAQANAQGDSGRQSQTRSQPSAANPVSTAGSPDAEPAPEPTDGLYA